MPSKAHAEVLSESDQPQTSGAAVLRHALWTARVLIAFVLPLVMGCGALGTTSALAISRDSVLARAQTWVNVPVDYSQTKYRNAYRRDCSGYVSMCWKTGTSYSTRTFSKVSHKIAASSLKPGDALLKKGAHIRLFYGWVDATHTDYVAYEAANEQASVCLIQNIQDDLDAGYVPIRYNKITNSPASTNLLKNGNFNVWSTTEDSFGGEVPIWWTVTGPPETSPVECVMEAFRSGVKQPTLALSNPSTDESTYTEVSQSARVTPGTSYRLRVWAATPCLPSDVTLSIYYLDAAGNYLLPGYATTLVGAEGTAAYPPRAMTIDTTAPSTAAKALVQMGLGGGTTNDDGTITQGTLVYFDDISLARR
jgi:hypothetical protein